MQFQEIVDILTQELGEPSEIQKDVVQPFIVVDGSRLIDYCTILQQNEKLFFDHLNCITGVDNGDKVGTIDVLYHFTSIILGHTFVVKVIVVRDLEQKPSIPSISSIWRTADWHERECYDFFGITFENHPDLRRILLPANWEGFPMRKDYGEQEYYHGIKVKY